MAQQPKKYNNTRNGNQSRNNSKNYKPRTHGNSVAKKVHNPVKSKFPLDSIRNAVLYSFIINNRTDKQTTMNILHSILKGEMDIVVISIHKSIKDIMQDEISKEFSKNQEQIFFQFYNKESEYTLHNKAFIAHESDIFIATNSNMEPRQNAIEILKKSLLKDNTVISVPTVYDKNLIIQKYCLRSPTLLSRIKILFGSKKETLRLHMMDKGEGSYYKTHKISASLSQIVVLNSKAFKNAGMFPKKMDNHANIFIFYKNMLHNGVALFNPTARFIEHGKASTKKCCISKICYFVKNVF